MSSQQDKVTSHKDALGKVISVGDFVAGPQSNRLMLATVTKLNPKMVQIKEIGSRSTINKYSHDLVILNPKDLTMYILTNSEKGRKNAYY